MDRNNTHTHRSPFYSLHGTHHVLAHRCIRVHMHGQEQPICTHSAHMHTGRWSTDGSTETHSHRNSKCTAALAVATQTPGRAALPLHTLSGQAWGHLSGHIGIAPLGTRSVPHRRALASTTPDAIAAAAPAAATGRALTPLPQAAGGKSGGRARWSVRSAGSPSPPGPPPRPSPRRQAPQAEPPPAALSAA